VSGLTTSLREQSTEFRKDTERQRLRMRATVRPVGFALRTLRLLVQWSIVGAVSTLLLGLAVPSLLGYHNLVVMSGSMEPAIHTGDLVIDKEISPLDARVGDVVTFRDPEDPSLLISHRVMKIEIRGNKVRFTTKGDNSNALQRWGVAANGKIGRVELHLWKLGYPLFWVATRWGRMLLVVVPALLLGIWEVVRIWRPKKGGSGAAS
jgi:signal peptidase